MTALTAIATIGPSGTCPFCVRTNVLCFAFIAGTVPETKSPSLEQIEAALHNPLPSTGRRRTPRSV